MTKTPHYLRFVQAVLLAAAVPACSDASETPTTPSTAQETKTEEKKTDEQATSPLPDSSEDAGADATLPFSSGPLMPPAFA